MGGMMAYTVQVGSTAYHGLRGNIHVHSTASDGTRSHGELAEEAARAGLDFLIVTDHNVFEPGLDAWIEDVLLLVGEEVHDVTREPQSSHTLCFNIQTDMAPHAQDPQKLIDAVAEDGGFTFLAHPFERDAAPFLREPNLSWRDWQVAGYDGIELWNYMSEVKASLRTKAMAVAYAYAPAIVGTGPFRETLDKWDALLGQGRMSVLGGSDAHARRYHVGRLSRVVQPYEYLFRSLNTHLLADRALTGDLGADKETVYGALRSGRSYLGYEQPGATDGFVFWASSGGKEVTMGEELELEGTARLQVELPARAKVRLLRDGNPIAQARDTRLSCICARPGVYRVEAYRRFAGRQRGWIFSNPIYVR
jgi:hypothetical protein